MQHENDGDTNCVSSTWDGPKRFGKKIEDKMKNGNHPDYSFFFY